MTWLLSFSLAAALGLGGAAPSASDARAAVARGRYLANGIARCFWCHAPLDGSDPATPRPELLGSGDVLDEKTPIIGPNITPDRDTGIGRWRDAEVVRAIRDGVGRDGRRLRNDHPSTYYSVMSDEDAAAIVAYLRSLAPIRKARPRSAPAADPGETVQRRLRPAAPEALATRAGRGAYLVQLGECLGCHTTTTAAGRPFREMEFGGGRRFFVEKGVGSEFSPDPPFTAEARQGTARDATLVASANITPDASGIAFYDEDVFIRTIKSGRVGGVRRLSSAMPWVFFSTLTDDDLGAIFTYLRALAPVRHRVNNTEAPTFCAVCGRRHGLGALNAGPRPDPAPAAGAIP